jgi:3-hydroxybutyryl-CoA dehydrogenase
MPWRAVFAELDPVAADALASRLTDAGIRFLRHQAPETGLVIAAAQPARRVLDAALAAGRPADTAGIHLTGPEEAKPDLAEVVITHLTTRGAAASAAALAARLAPAVVITRDRPGFLAAALAYPQLNDAVRMVQDGYATTADIDLAMMLGCGYPRGPLQLLDDTGPAPVLRVLSAMHDAYGDPAFAPVLLLAEHAAAGTSFRAPG